jgi:hypothetical protein
MEHVIWDCLNVTEIELSVYIGVKYVMVSAYLKANILSVQYRVFQKFCDISCFACISVQEYDKTLIVFLKDAPSNSLQTSIGLNLEQ